MRTIVLLLVLLVVLWASLSFTLVPFWYLIKITHDYDKEIVALGTLLIGAATICLYRMSKRQALHFETAERPWISVSAELRKPIEFKDGFGRVWVVFTLQNTGRSPAIRLDVRAKICPMTIDAVAELKKLSETEPPYSAWLDSDDSGWRRRTFGQTIFPKGFLRVPDQLVLQADSIKAAAGSDKIMFLQPSIVGLVTYKTAFSETERHTGFIIDVAIAHPEAPEIFPGHLLKDGRADDGEIPVSRVILHTTFISGYVS
jgi:hypothetical protein